ncbi:hypothetical protein VTI74DRAFT_9378 [Chaetomium olivicolor]
MATTIGPDMMINPPSPDGLDHGAVLHLPGAAAINDMAAQEAHPSNSQASLRSNPPPPNPPFVFPARPSSSSAPSSFSRATGRRPRSAIEPHSMVPNASAQNDKPATRSPALPVFSFNPGASLPPTSALDNMFLSPPQSPSAPNSPRLGATRPAGHGHRRGGSEFVGGSIRDGEAITVMNVSPTKSDSGMASPLLQPTRPRRGHAHRRSAAISSHDLSSIIIPPTHSSAKGTSAPSSPTVPERPSTHNFPVPDKAAEAAETTPSPTPGPLPQASDPSPPAAQPEQAPRPPARNRVGFSDTLEYIPRPLSLVSTDTSSTVTARPGHSLSGSISSVISVTNTDRDVNSLAGSFSAPRPHDSRPSTAGAVMERTQSQEQDPALRSPRRRGSIPLLHDLPPTLPLSPATPSPTRSGKKWSFFGKDLVVAGSPTRTQPDSPLSTVSHLSMTERHSAERVTVMDLHEAPECLDTPKPASKKKSKKQKKVKTWAGSILSRKGKHRHGKQKRRAPTPPPPRHPELADDTDDGEIRMSSEPEFDRSQSPGNGDWETWTFPKTATVQDEDASYPMIDLDAALGPFNTPLPRNPEWEAAQRAGGLIKKQLHSAAGMSRFSGPGMHYHHRRAESAPELVPIEGGRFGFRRFGSSSTMADVFEEDEEEEESTVSSTGPSTPAAPASVAEKPEAAAQPEDSSKSGYQTNSEAGSAISAPVEASHNISCAREDSLNPTGSADQPPGSACDDMILFEPAPPFWNGCQGSSTGNSNSGSATPSPRHVFRPKELPPVEVSPLNLPSASLGPGSPWSMTQSSAVPSPRSPMSYDAQCISTAPSSVTEDNFQSLLMGEPGPEVRISVDDIPSLTSTNSAMTRESILAQNPQARYPPLGDQPRPASFTSTAFGRRRSSLASLSRLINSSHGERSKLSIEVQLDSEPEKKTKTSKTKRLSRMMQFWKPKESHSA